MATTQFEIISGQILSYPENTPLKDLTVKVYDRNDNELQSTITDDNGNYRLVFDIPANETVNLRVYTGEYLLKANNDIATGTKDSKTVVNFSITLPAIIYGRVVDNYDNPIPGKIIKVYRKLFGSDELLYSTTSSTDGLFFAYYDYNDSNTNIITNLYNSENLNEAYISSGVISNTPKIKEINFVASNEKYIGIPLKNELDSKLSEKLEGIANLSDLKKDDIRILSEQSKVSVANINNYINSKIIFSKFNFLGSLINEDIIFALLAGGVPADSKQFFTQAAITYEKSLLKAVDANIIKSEIFANHDFLIQVVTDIQKSAVLNIQLIPGDNFSLSNIFNNVTFKDKPEQTEFIERYILNTLPDKEFWEKLPDVYLETDKTTIKLNIDLMLFSDYNIKVYNAISNYALSKSILSVAGIAENQPDWTLMTATVIEFPEFVIGETQAEKVNNYAVYFRNKIEKRFPLETIKNFIKKSPLISTSFKEFIYSYPSFNLFIEELNGYFAEKGISLESDLFKEVQKIRRLAGIIPLTNQEQALTGLLSMSDINSAHAVLSKGREIFYTESQVAGIDLEDAKLIWQNAKTRKAQTLAAFIKYNSNINSFNTTVLKQS